MPWLNAMLALAEAIQQIPAPTGEEMERARFVHAQWEAAGVPAEIDALGNVFARLPGSDPAAAPVVISAHLDTVFPRETPLILRREGERICGPGIGDNSIAVAALFTLHQQLRETDLPGDVWLVANVSEEGLGNLKGMKAVVARFGARPRAYIVLEGMGLGWVYHRGLGVRRYALKVRTAGGHAWADAGQPSAVHEMAALIARLAALPLPPRASLNVGACRGGVSVNTIAPEAVAEVDIRAETPAALQSVVTRFEKTAHRARRDGVDVAWEAIGHRPAGGIPATHPLVQAALTALRQQGVAPRTTAASTDANVPLSSGLPAVCLGLTRGHGAHTQQECIDIPPLRQGMAALTALVKMVNQ